MHERRWVFDTVSLSNFFLAEADFILEMRYRNRGAIPWQVYSELSSGMTAFPQLAIIDRYIDDAIFDFCHLSRTSRQIFVSLIGHLGKGEASCIAFAKVEKAIVVTDDRVARKQCRHMALPFTGTVGILKAAVNDGQIDLTEADRVLEKMLRAGFYSPVRRISEIANP